MTQTLELHVRYTDGRGETKATRRGNTRENRDYLDRVAWRLLASPRVSSVRVEIVEGRTAGYCRDERSIA